MVADTGAMLLLKAVVLWQDSKACGFVKGLEINHSGDGFGDTICFIVKNDLYSGSLILDSEWSYLQGLYAEEAH